MAVFSISAAIALAAISDGVALAQNNKPQNNASAEQCLAEQCPAEQLPRSVRAKQAARRLASLAESISSKTWPSADSATRRATAMEILTGRGGCRARPSPTYRRSPTWIGRINAPRIGGTPPANDADMIKLLTTGIWTDGKHLRLPMPQFRMDRSDAEAVVAYLKSVTSQP